MSERRLEGIERRLLQSGRIPASERSMLLILSVLMGFASISTDVYLPALPAMVLALHTTTGTAAHTISGFLIGFAFGQLVWGPIADRHGRRRPVIAGILLFTIGSALCAMSTSAWQIISARILQSIGACAAVVLARAMVRDLYQEDEVARKLSRLIAVMAMAPLLGPLMGSEILELASWRGIFWVLTGVGLVTVGLAAHLPETLSEARRREVSLTQALLDYAFLLRDGRFLACAGSGGLFYGGVYAYIGASPFAYIGYYGVSPHAYGLLFSAGIVGIMTSNAVNARLVVRIGAMRMLRMGCAAAAVAAACVAFAASTGAGGLGGLAASLCLFIGLSGFVIANSIAGAMARFPNHAGAVSALTGALHYGTGILGAALVGYLADGSPRPLGIVVLVCGTASALCACSVKDRPR